MKPLDMGKGERKDHALTPRLLSRGETKKTNLNPPTFLCPFFSEGMSQQLLGDRIEPGSPAEHPEHACGERSSLSVFCSVRLRGFLRSL